MLLVDCSKWQDDNHTPKQIDFELMASRGVKGVFIKATQYQVDPDFRYNWQAAKDAGLPRGAYHFANKSQWKSARQQAQFLWDTIKNDPGELPPVLDFETRDGIGLSWIKGFLEELKGLSGKTPIFYTGNSVWNDLRDSENAFWILEYPLWISYPDTSLTAPVRGIPDELDDNPTYSSGKLAIPNTWVKKGVPWTFWQFSYVGDGPYYGAESKGLDMNKFNGDLMDFYDFIGAGEVQPPQPSEDFIEVIAESFLRFRPEPVYNTNIKTLIVEHGEVLQIAGTPIYEQASGINWLPVFTPARYEGDFIGYVSADKKYVRYL